MFYNDQPEINPIINFKNYSDVLIESIQNVEPPRFSIGIFGKYGSGKTTLMKLVYNQLLKESNKNSYLPVWFDAWRYEKERNLLIPLLLNIYEQISEGKISKNLIDKFSGAMRSLLDASTINSYFVKVDLGKALKKESEYLSENTLGLKNSFHEMINVLKLLPVYGNGNRKVVIFIDDLDRCVPHKSLYMLECLKTVFDLDNYIFIFALDSRVITDYLYDKYRDMKNIESKEYIEKMVQIPFYLPSLTEDDINCIFDNYLAQKLEIDDQKLLKKYIRYFPDNVRKIKRLINRYSILRKIEKFDGNNESIVIALLLQEQWPSYFDLLLKHRNLFLDCCEMIYNNRALDNNYNEIADAIKLIERNNKFEQFYLTHLKTLDALKTGKASFFEIIPFLGSY